MLTIEHVGKIYPKGARALGDISLAVAPGEAVAIIGGSGCGKTTLLRAICGLEQVTHGRIALDGAAIAAPHPKIGVVFQEPRLLPWLTVAGNVGFGLAHLPARQRRDAVRAGLRRVGLLDHVDRWPRQLSGGQAQRVAIARALVPRPSVLLLDEPFAALDAFTRADLQDQVRDLWRDAGLTLLLVTHDLEEAVYLADRVVVLRPNPGRIAAELRVDRARAGERSSLAFAEAKQAIAQVLGETLRPRVLRRDANDAAPHSACFESRNNAAAPAA